MTFQSFFMLMTNQPFFFAFDLAAFNIVPLALQRGRPLHLVEMHRCSILKSIIARTTSAPN
jgi:hypothetical protein